MKWRLIWYASLVSKWAWRQRKKERQATKHDANLQLWDKVLSRFSALYTPILQNTLFASNLPLKKTHFSWANSFFISSRERGPYCHLGFSCSNIVHTCVLYNIGPWHKETLLFFQAAWILPPEEYIQCSTNNNMKKEKSLFLAKKRIGLCSEQQRSYKLHTLQNPWCFYSNLCSTQLCHFSPNKICFINFQKPGHLIPPPPLKASSTNPYSSSAVVFVPTEYSSSKQKVFQTFFSTLSLSHSIVQLRLGHYCVS